MATEAENSVNDKRRRPERVRITYKRKFSGLSFYLQARCDADSLLFECKARLPSSLSLCSFIVVLQISIALGMAKDNNGKNRELIKRIEVDPYMSCAVL